MKWLPILLLLTVPAMAQTEPHCITTSAGYYCSTDEHITLPQPTLPIDPYMSGRSLLTTDGATISAYTPRCPKDYTVVCSGYDVKCAKDLVDPK